MTGLSSHQKPTGRVKTQETSERLVLKQFYFQSAALQPPHLCRRSSSQGSYSVSPNVTLQAAHAVRTERNGGSIGFYFQINKTPFLYVRAFHVLTLLAFQAEMLCHGDCAGHRRMFSSIWPLPTECQGHPPSSAPETRQPNRPSGIAECQGEGPLGGEELLS